MKKRIYLFIILLVFIQILVSFYFIFNNKNKYVFKEQRVNENIEFKDSYEILNNKTYSYKGTTYKWSDVEINENNNMVSITFKEVIDLLDNKTGILYFSRPTCPWCRLMTPILINLSNDKKENVYYYNVVPDRDKNNDNYKTLVEKLYNYLPVDTYTQNIDDEDFDNTKHGVVQPMIFFIKDGKVVSYIYGFQHKYLQNNEKDKMYELLGESYEKMVD